MLPRKQGKLPSQSPTSTNNQTPAAAGNSNGNNENQSNSLMPSGNLTGAQSSTNHTNGSISNNSQNTNQNGNNLNVNNSIGSILHQMVLTMHQGTAMEMEQILPCYKRCSKH